MHRDPDPSLAKALPARRKKRPIEFFRTEPKSAQEWGWQLMHVTNSSFSASSGSDKFKISARTFSHLHSSTSTPNAATASGSSRRFGILGHSVLKNLPNRHA